MGKIRVRETETGKRFVMRGEAGSITAMTFAWGDVYQRIVGDGWQFLVTDELVAIEMAKTGATGWAVKVRPVFEGE